MAPQSLEVSLASFCPTSLAEHIKGRRLHCCARQESRSQAKQGGDEGVNTRKSLQGGSEIDAFLGASA